MFDFYKGQDEPANINELEEDNENEKKTLAVTAKKPVVVEALNADSESDANENAVEAEYEVEEPSDIHDKKKNDVLEAGQPDKHSKFALLSVKNYFWSMFFMGIPVVGWLLALIWAVGLCKNRNRRNLARAFVIWIFIGLVVTVIAYFAAKWFLIPRIDTLLASDSFKQFIESLKAL